MDTTRKVLLATTLLMVADVALAHHSYSMFDRTRRVILQGTVKALEWANPHVWVWIDSTDGKGGEATEENYHDPSH